MSEIEPYFGRALGADRRLMEGASPPNREKSHPWATRTWTFEEVCLLERLFRSREGRAQLPELLDRTSDAIRQKAQTLGLTGGGYEGSEVMPIPDELSAEDYTKYLSHPCPFRPGTKEKIRVLSLRGQKGLPLFIIGDGE